MALLAPALAIFALLPAGAASAATATAAVPAAGPEGRFAFAEIELSADHGLHAQVESNSEGIYLRISRGDPEGGRGESVVSYQVRGESTATGLRARFGKLGLIDVVFQPTETRLEKPPKECKGPPSTSSQGLFVGTIDFTGEEGYVRIEATQAKGSMWVSREREWRCPKRRRSSRAHGPRPRPTVASRPFPKAKAKPTAATLVASSDRRHCFLAAHAERGRGGRGSTTFVGAEYEKREGMEIGRATAVQAAPSSFAFDHRAGTARLRPPRPFSGSATFKRRPHRPDLWRSTIRVPLLGADPLRIGSTGFKVALLSESPGFR